jgi:hypothetical protein
VLASPMPCGLVNSRFSLLRILKNGNVKIDYFTILISGNVKISKMGMLISHL